jgi:hypothetical protein
LIEAVEYPLRELPLSVKEYYFHAGLFHRLDEGSLGPLPWDACGHRCAFLSKTDRSIDPEILASDVREHLTRDETNPEGHVIMYTGVERS